MTASSQIREYTIPEIQAEIQHLRQAYMSLDNSYFNVKVRKPSVLERFWTILS